MIKPFFTSNWLIAASFLLVTFTFWMPSAYPAQLVQDADIVVTNHFDSSVSIIHNTGNRTFVKQIPNLVSARNPTEPSVGDLNHDDLIDLVVVDGFGQPTLSLFFGQSNGQFSARSALNIGFDVAMTAIGDFNKDGNADLFVSHWSGGSGNEVRILLGNGLGGFSVGTTRSNIPGANAVDVGDFDKDGNLDGVVTNWTAGSVTVLFGDGAGGFRSPANDVILSAGNRPQNVVVGDFNKDNNPDLAFAHGLFPFLSVYLGNGNGTFGSRMDLPADAGNGGSSIVKTGDLDSNGYDDLITFNGSTKLAVFLWDPQQGGFASPVISPIEPTIADDLAVAYFDSDGWVDVVVTDRADNKISIYFGDGAGHFGSQPQLDVPVGAGPVGVAVANFPSPVNQPPIVDAGNNVLITTAQQTNTVLQGTVTDPDGDALQYRWLEGTFVLKNTTSVGTNGAAPMDLATVPPLSIGEHTLTLEGTDGQTTITDGMILTINNSPPIVAPVGGGTVQLGDDILLQGQVADYDGDTLTYTWSEGSFILAQGIINTVAEGNPVDLPEHIITGGLPLGLHTLTLGASDGTNPIVSADIDLAVIDTNAPTLQPSISPTILWPPDHTMRTVTIQANAADSSGQVTLSASVTSSEPPEADGDGNTIFDFTTPVIDQSTGVITLQLRAERQGQGDGRTYTILITATDGSGNSSSAVVEAMAPHDRGR
ncbi:MAG: VCBS repeat-containing protein [Candidatus Omnitrophica bacterium]|nr:VCBS repeat-containing protein [Candidatus Omnitrophota bacterium]